MNHDRFNPKQDKLQDDFTHATFSIAGSGILITVSSVKEWKDPVWFFQSDLGEDHPLSKQKTYDSLESIQSAYKAFFEMFPTIRYVKDLIDTADDASFEPVENWYQPEAS